MRIKRSTLVAYGVLLEPVSASRLRKLLFGDEVPRATEELFLEISCDGDRDDPMAERAENGLQTLALLPLRFSLEEITSILNSVSANEVFRCYPAMKREL